MFSPRRSLKEMELFEKSKFAGIKQYDSNENNSLYGVDEFENDGAKINKPFEKLTLNPIHSESNSNTQKENMVHAEPRVTINFVTPNIEQIGDEEILIKTDGHKLHTNFQYDSNRQVEYKLENSFHKGSTDAKALDDKDGSMSIKSSRSIRSIHNKRHVTRNNPEDFLKLNEE